MIAPGDRWKLARPPLEYEPWFDDLDVSEIHNLDSPAQATWPICPPCRHCAHSRPLAV